MTFHVDERNEPPHRVTAQFGGSSFLFTVAKAPTRLFVVLMAAVKPLDDVVAGYTSRNSD